MFKISDAWGIAAAMLSLIALYLILSKPSALQNIISSSATGISSVSKVLQGR